MTRPALLLLSLTAIAGLGCESEQAADASASPTEVPSVVAPPPAMRVEVAAMQPSEARLVLNLPGEVQGTRDATLSAALGGFVEAVLVEEGDKVKKGAVLARVDRDLRAVAVEQAEADLNQAQIDLGRLEALGDLGTESQLSTAQTRVTMAEASLKQARIQLERTTIRAPFAGVIAALELEEGEVTNPGAPAIRLVQLDPAIVALSVSDRDVVSLKEGMEVSVTADARLQPKIGKVERILPAGDLKTRAFVVEVEVANRDRSLLPGMIASAQVSEVVAEEALVLPQDFLVTRLDGLGVYVEQGGVATWRPVTVSTVVGDQAVIGSGLEVGDRVVVNGHRDLAPGDPLLVSRAGSCCSFGRAVF